MAEPKLLQVSKVMGATVVAVARGPEKAAALRDLGADHVIDAAASSAPLRQQVKVWPQPCLRQGLMQRSLELCS